ncbi:MAG: hypothetical protein GY754_13600 [bacterium]|nr:hypothetical protein [bacterium]
MKKTFLLLLILTATPGNSMDSIINKLLSGPDPAYSSLLKKLKHKTDFPAPLEFRKLMLTLSPFRLDLNMGVIYKEKRVRFTWYSNEVGVKGKPAEVLETIKKALSAEGFSYKAKGDNQYGSPEHSLYKEENLLKHDFLIEGPRKFTGGRGPACGSRIMYEVEYLKDSAPPSVKDILLANPALSCPELPPQLLEYLNDKKIDSLFYGGTWTRYYDWGVRTPCGSAAGAKKAFSEVKSIILKMGFKLSRKSRGVSTFSKTGTRYPIIYLSVEKGGIFYFRIQPYT